MEFAPDTGAEEVPPREMSVVIAGTAVERQCTDDFLEMTQAHIDEKLTLQSAAQLKFRFFKSEYPT